MKSFLLPFALVMLVWSCSAPSEPTFEAMKNVKLKAATLKGEIILTGDAVFNNPNSLGADINGIDFIVMVDSNQVAQVQQNVTMKMPANADFTLPIEIDIPIKKVFEEAKGGMLMNILKNQKTDVQLDGNIEVNFGGVLFKIPFEHHEEHKINIGF
ncbi:MAG: LEA type 2 family protein [Bacteroidia bacterium]|nr:LEA type 2 family protein [Bacteroidia bacterium]